MMAKSQHLFSPDICSVEEQALRKGQAVSVGSGNINGPSESIKKYHYQLTEQQPRDDSSLH